MLEERLAEQTRSQPVDYVRAKAPPAAPAVPLTQTRVRTDTSSSLVGSYEAYIGRDDLFNSSGVRLTTPAAILRQDRANFHRFGMRQPGDTEDNFFASAANRATMEKMVAGGTISVQAQRLILAGDAIIHVEIYSSSSAGDYLAVTVS